MAAQLGQGWGHALVVPRGAEEVVEDLQDGADVTPRPPAAVLAVGVQRACREHGRRSVPAGRNPGVPCRRVAGVCGSPRATWWFPHPPTPVYVHAAAPGTHTCEPCHLPEKVPEKTPGAWFTKLSMTAPGLRERDAGLPTGVDAGLVPVLAAGEQSIC